MEGRKGQQHQWKPFEFFRRSSGILSRLFRGVCSQSCPNKTFVGQDAVGRQRARHGRQNALMKALHSSGRPYTIALVSNLFLDEGSIHMCGRIGLHKFQPVLVGCV